MTTRYRSKVELSLSGDDERSIDAVITGLKRSHIGKLYEIEIARLGYTQEVEQDGEWKRVEDATK